jgi:hypothetical protein
MAPKLIPASTLSKLMPKDVWPLVGLVSIVLSFGAYKGIEHLTVSVSLSEGILRMSAWLAGRWTTTATSPLPTLASARPAEPRRQLQPRHALDGAVGEAG